MYLLFPWIHVFSANHARKGPLQDVPLTVMPQPHPKSCKGVNIMNGEARNSKQPGWGWTETSGTDPWPIKETLMLDNFLCKKFYENLTQHKVFTTKRYMNFLGHKLLFLPCALCALNFASLLAALPKMSSFFQDFSLFGLLNHLVSLTWHLARRFFQSH